MKSTVSATGISRQHHVRATLGTAATLVDQQHIEQAISLLSTLVHRDPCLTHAYRLRADAFARIDHPDEALRDCTHALALAPGHPVISEMRTRFREVIRRRSMANRRLGHIGPFEATAYLGAGMEGAVYRSRNREGRRYVVKRFYPHRIRQIHEGIGWHRKPVAPMVASLERMTRTLREHPHPVLYAYELVLSGDRIEGLAYPCEPLYSISRLNRSVIDAPDFARSMLGAAISAQAHLLRHAGMLKTDMTQYQYLMNARGDLRFIDYGPSVVPADDFRCTEDRAHLAMLLRLLYWLFNPEEARRYYDHSSGTHFNGRNFEAILHPRRGLLRALEVVPELQPLFEHIARDDYAPFLDASFYECIAAALPRRLTRWRAARAMLQFRRRRLRHEFGEFIGRYTS